MMLVGGVLHAAPEGGAPAAPPAPADGGALSRTTSGAAMPGSKEAPPARSDSGALSRTNSGIVMPGSTGPPPAEGSTASGAQAPAREGDAGSGTTSAPPQPAGGASHLVEHMQALGCLRAAVSQGLLSREELKQVGAL